MSIRNEEGGGNNGGNQGGSHPGQQPQNHGWSFHDHGLFDNPIPKGVGSEYFNKFFSALTEIYKQANSATEIGLIDLSRAVEPTLDFSCIVVTTRLRDFPQLGVAYHVLLLAATGDEIPPYADTIPDGRQVLVYRAPSDAINQILLDKARQQIRSKWKGVDQLLFVDGTVVPTHFPIDDRSALQNLALNAAIAGVTELNTRRAGFKDLDLSTLNKQGQSFVEITFQPQQLTDAAANIYRSDVQINLTDRKTGAGERDRKLNSGERTSVFSSLSAYLDVVWFPVAPQNQYSPFMPMNATPTQKFAPRLIITDIGANYAQTPGAVLLALSTALAMRAPTIWFQAFKPNLNTGRNEIDLRDIGALNIEGNIPVPQGNGVLAPDPSGKGKVIDTKSDDFKIEHLGVFMNMLFRHELFISLDIPEFGPQSQYLSLFSAAAGARPDQKAIQRIISAANDLTAGQFSNKFPKNGQIFVTQSERIHLGTWTHKDGSVRDLRDLDYIAVANLVGTRYPDTIKDFSDTYLRTDLPEIQRLEARRRMIQQLTNDTAKFTGWAQRVTFTAQFLNALDEAIAQHKLQPSIRTPQSGNDFFQQRGIAGYAQAALLGSAPGYLQMGGSYAPTVAPQQGYSTYRAY